MTSSTPTAARRTLVALAGAVLAGAGLGSALPASASAPASTPPRAVARTATPALPAGLPGAIEDLAGYVPQTSCDTDAKPGTLALARLLVATYPGTGYTVAKPCGSESLASEHADGRAFDWTVSARSATGKAQGDAFVSWLFAPDAAGRPFAVARRLGVMYVIWNDRIWRSYSAMAGWSAYSTCAAHPEPSADAVCHRDRLHVSLSWPGALARTSFWSRSVAPPDYGPCRPKDLNWAPAWTARTPTACPSYPVVAAPAGSSPTYAALVKFSGATIGPGDSNPIVTALQKAIGVTADGDYGPWTADAVTALQRRHSLPPSGAMDAATWRALLADLAPAQETPQPVPVPSGNSLTKYKNTVLQYGSRGPAVIALQQRLKVTASGWFGPKTQVAVVTFQVGAKLPATGVVDAATWAALGA